MKWKLAQILEVRYEVPYDEDAVFWDPQEDGGQAAAGKTTTETAGGAK